MHAAVHVLLCTLLGPKCSACWTILSGRASPGLHYSYNLKTTEQCFEKKTTANVAKTSSQLANTAEIQLKIWCVLKLGNKYSAYFSKLYGTVVWLFMLGMKINTPVVSIFIQ